MKTLIKNCRIIDENKDFIGDIYIENGKITDFGENLSYDCETILGKGLALMPAFIDMHVHFRDPGYTYKEDIETGSLAALRGGYTLVNLMANTDPICSSMKIVESILKKSEDMDLIDIHQMVSITEDFDGKTLDHLDTLDNRVQFISDDGQDVHSNLTMYKAMLKAKELDLTISSHAEEEYIVELDSRLSENLMSLRNIYLSKVTKSKLHLAHVSTIETIEEIRKAKAEGVNVTCEVTPHHISLHNSDYRVNPPIREEQDVKALIEGIKDGTVDAIATDHAPHSAEDKSNGAPGISGIETAFPISYTSLVRSGDISLKKLSHIMSSRPGELMKANKGKIEKGYDGDLVLLDLDREIEIHGKDFVSKGKNTPFEGKKFYGEIIGTFKNGELKYNGGVKFDNR